MDPTTRALMERSLALFNGDDEQLAIFDPEVTAYESISLVQIPPLAEGVEGLRTLVQAFRAPFPDLAITPTRLMGQGATGVCRWTARGTHLGPLLGLNIRPTAKPVELDGHFMLRRGGELVVEFWVTSDWRVLLPQIGSGPTPPPGR